jgi:hypothetical protein
MRYALRNQQKIEAAYPGTIGRILKSLSAHFESGKEILPMESGEEFPIIVIDDIGHSMNMIAFYIIDIKFDVYRLAFKEFIG